MRNKKVLIILAVVLAVLVAASIFLMNIDTHREKVRAEAGTLMKFKGSDITSFEWTYGNSDFCFVQEDGSWISPDDKDFPVNSQKIINLLASIQNLQTSFTVENPDTLATYGLKNPKCSVTVSADKEYHLDFGDVSSMDGLRYVSVGDGKVYLATEDVMEDFDLNVYSVMQFDGFPECDLVTEFIIEGKNNLHIYYDDKTPHGYANSLRYYIKEGGAYKALGTLDTSNFIGYFTGYELVDFITFKTDDATLENYNLKNPEITITAKYLPKEDSVETETVKYYMSMAQDNIAYIKKDGSPVIYRMDPKDFDYFAEAGYDTLKPKDLSLLTEEEIDKVVVSMDGENYTITLDHDTKEYALFDWEGKDIDLSPALKKLNETAVKDFKTVSHLGSKVLAVRLYGSNGNYTSRLIEVYNSTAEHSLVKIDGVLLGRASREDALELVESFVKILQAEEEE